MRELYNLVKCVRKINNEFGNHHVSFVDFFPSIGNAWIEISLGSQFFLCSDIKYTHYTFDVREYYHLKLYTTDGIVIRTCLSRSEFIDWWRSCA